MVTRSELLRRLPVYTNTEKVIVDEQNTDDIISAMLRAHKKYAADYEKICDLFYTGDVKSTAENIFNYIKKNIRYVIEPDDLQLIKSPSAIVATPSSDCKNYALFINGVLDACRRKFGMDCDLFYRFAAYDGTNIPQHTYSVLLDDKHGEIWTDPVLTFFNQNKIPTYYKDKKIKNMALVGLSGINPYGNYQTSQTRSVNGFSFTNLTNQLQSLSSSPAAQAIQSAIPFGQQAGQILTQITQLFAKKPSRNDWIGWDALDSQENRPAGTTVAWWTITDGDSVENEANNILSYITQKMNSMEKVLDAAKTMYGYDKDSFLAKLYNKLERGGYGNEAAQIKSAFENVNKPAAQTTTATAPKTMTPPPPPPAAANKNNTGLYIGIGAAALIGIFLLTKKK